MTEQVLQVAEGFWNIRGDFRIGGVVNIGTHASLVRRRNGRFLLLDAYTLQGEVKAEIDALTNNGEDIEAVIQLHPFHTVHVPWAHQQFPQARHYGTRRHVERFTDLPWEKALSESDECAALFADDLQFSVPTGVDFISKNENLHFSSVLAYHPESRTIHVDDTLMVLQLPGPVGRLQTPGVAFHLTLAKTLERRAGAAADFRDWATGLADQWADAEHLCAAHTGALVSKGGQQHDIAGLICKALKKAERTLQAHEKKFG